MKETITIDELANVLHLPSYESVLRSSKNYREIYTDSAYKEALKKTASETKSMRAASYAEASLKDALYETWRSAIINVAIEAFNSIGLSMRQIKDQDRFQIYPKKSWLSSIYKLGEIIDQMNDSKQFVLDNLDLVKFKMINRKSLNTKYMEFWEGFWEM